MTSPISVTSVAPQFPTLSSLTIKRRMLAGVLASATAIATGAASPFLADHIGITAIAFALAATVGIGVLFIVPVRSLPPITLLVTLLIPTDSSLFPTALLALPLGVIPLVIWMVRAPGSWPVPRILRVTGVLFGIWLMLSEMFAPFHTFHGWQWLLTASVAVLFAAIRPPRGLQLGSFRVLFLRITTLIGCYALIEGFVLHENPVFGALFHNASWWAGQQGGVSYRVTTLFGHPLVNGAIFAAAAVLAAANLLERADRPWVSFASFLVLLGAVLATHSRGSALALAVGVVLVIIFSRRRLSAHGARRLLLVASAALGAAVIVGGLQARNDSVGGRANAAARASVLGRAAQLVRGVEPFGAGPGQSEKLRAAMRLPGPDIPLENSYAELAVSLGPIGALLAILTLGIPPIITLRKSAMVGEAAALIAVLVAIGGFNAIEGDPSLLILVGLFVITLATPTIPSSDLGSKDVQT